MDIVQLLGANVRRARQAKDLTQEKLALEADMKRSYLSELERGKRNPSLRAVGRLAAALEVDPDELLRRTTSEA